MTIRQFVHKNCWWIYRPLKKAYITKKYDNVMKRESMRLLNLHNADKRVFYLGVTAHVNLGDLGQHYCILKWINENYPSYQLEKFEADPVVYTKYNFIDRLKSIYRQQDIIIFQSGYTTQDLGGLHNLMHEMVVEALPNAKILMLPQTIFFQKEENKKHTGKILNTAKNMLFLARDFVSYETAKEMMPDVSIKAYPDIVTTLIGTLVYNNKRNGICLCTRNDGEKLYSAHEINNLASRFANENITVMQKDTQSNATFKEIRKDLKQHIEKEIESYSHFKVTITDRYHGTIFSLCAGTPVIIVKTTDHKVTTGADWFKGVYDDYVYVANNLEDAYNKAIVLLSKDMNNILNPFFKVEYYDILKDLFDKKIS